LKKALLIHSYNCNEPNWEQTVWGYPPDKPERLVTGVKVILEENIDIALTCGTAGEKEGKKECWWIRDRLYLGLEELREFTIFPVFQQYSLESIKKVLDRVLVVREKNTGVNTFGEAEYAGEFFANAGVGKVTIVSSPDHISRCMRDVLACWEKRYPLLAANLSGTASATLYSARTRDDAEIAKISNVVIAEPPIMRKFNLSRIFGILNNPDAILELDAVLQKYENKS